MLPITAWCESMTPVAPKEPRFDAEVAHGEMTDDGMVRQPLFKRLAVVVS
jgi:hypothetical protein